MADGIEPDGWVLDTNVVVSGLLSPHGPPGRLIDMVLIRQLRLAVDDRIIAEYREVLSRPKFAIRPERLQAVLNLMRYQRGVVSRPVPGMFALEDADTVFLEAAAAAADSILVTGNLRHFPEQTRGPVEVLTPTEAWRRLNR